MDWTFKLRYIGKKSVLENLARIRGSYYRRPTTWRRARRLVRTAARIRARYYEMPTDQH